MQIIYIKPIAKPRMTRQDRWKKRKCVVDYWAFKDELRKHNIKLSDKLEVEFHLKMPDSWSKKKKAQMLGKPHKQRPDVDNMCKAIMDCLLKEDSHIYHINASKYWSEEDYIVFY